MNKYIGNVFSLNSSDPSVMEDDKYKHEEILEFS